MERAREEGRQRSKPSRSARGLPTVEEQMREAAEANEEGAAGAGAEEAEAEEATLEDDDDEESEGEGGDADGGGAEWHTRGTGRPVAPDGSKRKVCWKVNSARLTLEPRVTNPTLLIAFARPRLTPPPTHAR